MFHRIGFFIARKINVNSLFSKFKILIVIIWVFRQKPGETQAALLPSRLPLYLLPAELRQKDVAPTANTEKVHKKTFPFRILASHPLHL
ncbi:hypothetical protein [Flavobacterium sp.]|uniref:hypothetical protein n=1 Tax=Flavobacterium sp. TaxID=239 RepID=UPI002606094B|nr:hypothetical protein [Flavobacterium sp.]